MKKPVLEPDAWLQRTAPRCRPLCGNDAFRVMSAAMQHRLNLTTVICEECSFVHTNPLPVRETYERFYQEAYSTYYGHLTARPLECSCHREPAEVRLRLDQIEQFIPLAGCKLLIGPGQGLFLWWAQQRGCHATGAEPTPEFHKTLQTDELPCFNTTLDQIASQTEQRYDALVMMHVFEHMYDPNEALQHCSNLLSEQGTLIIEVPNILTFGQNLAFSSFDLNQI